MNHRIGRNVFGFAVGLVVATLAYQWITDPNPRGERAQEEQAVEVSRTLLGAIVAAEDIDIVDPLAPNRKVGKVYVYAEPPGWAVSGYYRRNDRDGWHPYLMTMTPEFELHSLKVSDPELADKAAADARLEVSN